MIIREAIKKYQVILATILFLSFSLQLISEDIKGEGGDKIVRRLIMSISTVIQKPLSAASRALKDIWGGYIFLIGLKKENDLLRERVAILSGNNSTLREIFEENRRLREYLQMAESSIYPLIVARVIGLDFTGWNKIVVIDKGENDGIEKNMAVVAPEGVVGRILKVFPKASQVLLILDHNSSLDAIVQRNRVRGIVGGRGYDDLILRFVSKDDDIRLGDKIISSGLGGILPKGLLIGEVVKIKDSDREFFKDVKLSPVVDFLKLEEVLIIKRGSVSMVSDELSQS